jgi:uncharacterized protein (TIGR03435 family)
MTKCTTRNSRKSLLLAAGYVAIAASAALSQAIATQSEAGPPTSAKMPAFEVVSFKPNKSNGGSWQVTTTPAGFNATGVTLLDLIREAYGFNDSMANDRITGAPTWANAASYDVSVKVADSDLTEWQNPDQNKLMLMLQSLLADRFMLKIHRETKELSGYELVIAKGGPRLKEAKPKDPGGTGVSMVRASSQLTAQGVPMNALAKILTQQMARPVEDKTGLTGTYDFTLQWKPDHASAQMPSGPGSGPPRAAPALSAESSGPSIFKAIQEQLGLSLQPIKGPEQFLVIDHVEMPSEK